MCVRFRATTDVRVDPMPKSKPAPDRCCYVCGDTINNGPVHIGNHLYRHAGCVPGGTAYMKRDDLGKVYAAKFGVSLAEYRKAEGNV